MERSPDLFARLPREQQRAILGPAKLAAYEQGLIHLEDLVHRTHDRRCGTMRREASLHEAVGRQEAQRLAASIRGGGPGGGGNRRTSGGSGRGHDPEQRLLRELLTTGRQATDAEVVQILDRIATAPFSGLVRRVPAKDRGYSYQGHRLGARELSLTYHLTKRVAIEEQWSPGTTETQYVADLQTAARAASYLAVYHYGSDVAAAALAERAGIIPATRLGRQPQALILVLYSADQGRLITGYQVSSVAATTIPQEALWLRHPMTPL
ncbi:MAG TPA: hypothetical protein VK066_28970 [Chloroflexota bacterium]|nr:hypothetical protein [Chloroflexota bacterium]